MADESGRIGTSPYSSERQRVLNESWPLRDRNGRHARGIPDQPRPIDVEVRLVLSVDGEQEVAGHALRWTTSPVYVTGFTAPPGVGAGGLGGRRRRAAARR